jgi:hypothetical protein
VSACSTEIRQVVTTAKNMNKEEETGLITPSGAQKLHEISTSTSGSSSLADCFWPNGHPQYPVEPSQPSPPSPKENVVSNTSAAAEAAIVPSRPIYRVHPHSDTFGCQNCKKRGDIWHIQTHECKGSRK